MNNLEFSEDDIFTLIGLSEVGVLPDDLSLFLMELALKIAYSMGRDDLGEAINRLVNTKPVQY